VGAGSRALPVSALVGDLRDLVAAGGEPLDHAAGPHQMRRADDDQAVPVAVQERLDLGDPAGIAVCEEDLRQIGIVVSVRPRPY